MDRNWLLLDDDNPHYTLSRLHARGEHIYNAADELFQWRGFSWFLGFHRFCLGDDVAADLRHLHAHGVNLVRVFGPLPWVELKGQYRHDNFQMSKLGAFFDLLEQHGFYCEFVPLCYAWPGQSAFVQSIYDIAQHHANVLIEASNEPHVNKIDVISAMRGVDRHGVLSAYGVYQPYYTGGTVPSLDYVTIHTTRDGAWHRKARHAQELQHKLGKPCISDEPAKITETNFDYPGGKNDWNTTPAEAIWHGAICHLWTPGFTLHTEDGKWGRVSPAGTLQNLVLRHIALDVWQAIGADWQLGSYNGSHMSSSPVDFVEDIWTYSSLHSDRALSVRCSLSPPQPRSGWTVINRWGPKGSIAELQKS